jgi:hypothetical protein
LDESATFLLHGTFAAIATILVAACTTTAARLRLARRFRLVCMVLAGIGLLGVVIVSLPVTVTGLVAATRVTLRSVSYLDSLIVGIAAGATLATAVVAYEGRLASGRDVASRSLGVGLAIYMALAFFAFEIGKAAHDAQMRQFFVGSGYAVWFMYAVMLGEIAGAVALLAARTRFVGACWLGLLMLGAIVTHGRNGDPFSDSLDALRMLLLAACVAALTWLSRKAKRVR